MRKKLLLGSLIAVAILIVVSFTSVVGYNSIKSEPIETSTLFNIKTNTMIDEEGNINLSDDDITPPVTSILLEPPKPSGDNDWYIRSVGVLFVAEDDMSGVNATYYRVDGGSWNKYNGWSFRIKKDGYHVIDYYSIDNSGNIEKIKSSEFKIDQKSPWIEIEIKRVGLFKWKIIAEVSDETSGIDRVEFYVDGELNFTDYDYPYEWIWKVPGKVEFYLDSELILADYNYPCGWIGDDSVIAEVENPKCIGDHYIDIIVYDKAGNSATPMIPSS